MLVTYYILLLITIDSEKKNLKKTKIFFLFWSIFIIIQF